MSMEQAPGLRISHWLWAVAVAASACVSVGRPFPVEQVPNIQVGVHTQADIEGMFGPPWRTGIEDGEKTWTYGDYKRALFGAAKTRDLVIRFGSDGAVSSYSFSSDQAEDDAVKPRPAVEF